MANGVPILPGLGAGIMKPTIADFAGAQKFRRDEQALQLERARATETIERKKRSDAAFNELLKGTFSNQLGSRIEELGPEGFEKFAEFTGIPVKEKDRMKQIFGNAIFAKTALEKGTVEDAKRLITQRRDILNTSGQQTPRMDKFLQELDINPKNAEKNLNLFIDSTDAMIQANKDKTKLKPSQKTGSFLVKDAETGETKLVTGVFDPNTGQLTTSEATFGKDQIVSRLGETAEEQTKRRVAETRDKEQAKADIALVTAEDMSDILNRRKRNEILTTDQTKKLTNHITQGLNALDQLPNVTRGIELLKTIGTGGITAKSKVITDFFGTTKGELGELNNILAKNVLAGLANFKGAISDAEREFIAKMETNLAAGTAFNRTQLLRMENTLRKQVSRATEAARFTNDEFSLQLLENEGDATGFAARVTLPQGGQENLPILPTQPGAPPAAPVLTATGANGQKLQLINNQWVPVTGGQ